MVHINLETFLPYINKCLSHGPLDLDSVAGMLHIFVPVSNLPLFSPWLYNDEST